MVYPGAVEIHNIINMPPFFFTNDIHIKTVW